MRWLFVVVLVLVGVPQWSGADRLPLLPDDLVVHARAWRPAGGWPTRIGALRPIGAVALEAAHDSFGGFSALSVAHGRALLLSDGGNYVAVALRGDRVRTLASGSVRDGPDIGWRKQDRDSESLYEDPHTGELLVGFERANALWRYGPGFAPVIAHAAPAAMRRWPANGGAESLTRLRDGRYLVLAERPRRGDAREVLIFARDPAREGARAVRLRYVPPAGYDPSDATVLPGGDLLILNRLWRFPLRFSAKLVRIRANALRAGAVVRGREIATLRDDVIGENCEGLSVTREHGATMLWIATDNDGWRFRPSLLMKFELTGG